MFNKKICVITLLMIIFLVGCSQEKEQMSPLVAEKLTLASKYIIEANYEEAILTYKEIIKIDPKVEEAYQWAGEVYLSMGEVAEAEKILLEGIEKANSTDGLNDNLARIYLEQGRIKEAENIYQELLKSDDENPLAYIGLAEAQLLQGLFNEAEKTLHQGIKENSGIPELHNALAGLYQKTGKLEEARLQLEKVLELEVNSVESYTRLEQLYENDWEVLIARGEKLIKANNTTGYILKLFALLKGERYQEVVEIFSSNPELAKNPGAVIITAQALRNMDKVDQAEEIIARISIKENLDSSLIARLVNYYLSIQQYEKAKEIGAQTLAYEGWDATFNPLFLKLGKLQKGSHIYEQERVYQYVMQKLSSDFPLTFSEFKAQYKYKFLDVTGDGIDEVALLPKGQLYHFYVLALDGDSYKTILDVPPLGVSNAVEAYVERGFFKVITYSHYAGFDFRQLDIYKWDGTNLNKVLGDVRIDSVTKLAGIKLSEELSQIIGSEYQFEYILTEREYDEFTGALKLEKMTEHKRFKWDNEHFRYIEEELPLKPKVVSRSKNISNELFSYRGVNLGMTQEEVINILGEPEERDEDDEILPAIRWYYNAKGGTGEYTEYANMIRFDLHQKRVIELGIDKTISGIKVGEPVSKVIDIHGPGQILKNESFQATHDRFILYYYPQDSHSNIYFCIEHGIVSWIAIANDLYLD